MSSKKGQIDLIAYLKGYCIIKNVSANVNIYTIPVCVKRNFMIKKRPTVADVARLTGVSMMTVSRVMNDMPGVSEETRQRIREIAEQIGFRPSQIARGLATRHSATIGLVMPDVSNPFFAQIARGAEDAAYEQGYSLFLINTAESPERERSALDTLWQQEIDGAILSSPRLSTDVLYPIIERFPAVVLVNRELEKPRPGIGTINVDDRLGAQMAVKKFLALGRRRIGHLAGPDTSVSSRRRLEGYREALIESGIGFDQNLVEHCIPLTEGGCEGAHRLLERCPDLDAIFCFNDLSAVGAMQACLETKRAVPEDVAVIGADDIPLASLVTPRLSTLHVDPNSIGCQAMTMLTELINHPKRSPKPVVIQPELTLRQSAP